MGAFDIICGILLILSAVFLIIVIMLQEKSANMNSLTGASTESYFGRNEGNTKEAKLSRLTKITAVIFFVLTLAVNLVNVYVK